MTRGVPTTTTTTRQVSRAVNQSYLHESYNDVMAADVTAADMLGKLSLSADQSESCQNCQSIIAALVASRLEAECAIQALHLPSMNSCPDHAVPGFMRPPRTAADALPSWWMLIGVIQMPKKMVAKIVPLADKATLPLFEADLVTLVRHVLESSCRSQSRLEVPILLLCCGDVECNPGPVKCDPSAIAMQNAGKKNDPQVPPHAFYRKSELNIVNWNARGIQKYGLLEDLCHCMHDNDVDIAVVTETQFSLKGQPNHITSIKDFNIYYALPDSSILSSVATLQGKRLFGVCIIARKGLAVDIIKYGDGPCTSRMIHAKVIIATNDHNVADINVIAVYTPAQVSQRGMFFDHLLSYITSKPELLTANTIMCGDWNSYLDVDQDVYRLPELIADVRHDKHISCLKLMSFIEKLRSKRFYYDAATLYKHTVAFDSTYCRWDMKHRSILDRTFFSCSVESVTNYSILDWGLQHPDHKATLFTLSIEHLCNGFIEYQSSPFIE